MLPPVNILESFSSSSFFFFLAGFSVVVRIFLLRVFVGMGRGRGKGKKLTVVVSHEDPGSGGEVSLPAYKRRGQPQKALKEEVHEEAKKVKEDDGDNLQDVLNKEVEGPVAVDSVKKGKRYPQVKEKDDSVQEENGVMRSSNGELIKSNGFRQNGSRRKSKPRRAAEAGVECY